MRHLRTLHDLTTDEFHHILALSHRIKADFHKGLRPTWLAQRTLALLFEKPSLRTRVSFEAGMAQLGGSTIYLSRDVGWQTRESTKDFVRVLAEYCDLMVTRTFAHATVDELASYDALPIINGLTDAAHPCQALADLMTVQESVESCVGKQITYVGDANNVCRSLALAASLAGMRFRLLGVDGYLFQDAWLEQLQTHCPQAKIDQTTDPATALRDADFIYTDVWTSMGQEAEAPQRHATFQHLQLNPTLMRHAPSRCKVLHCLPAHRGEEIVDEVIDSPQSIVIQQAANRLHAQKGLMVWLGRESGWIDPQTYPRLEPPFNHPLS